VLVWKKEFLDFFEVCEIIRNELKVKLRNVVLDRFGMKELRIKVEKYFDDWKKEKF